MTKETDPIDDVEDKALDASFTFRLTSTEKEFITWLSSERAREIREAARVRSVRVSPADALRELLHNEIARRSWTPTTKPTSSKTSKRRGS